MTSTEHRAVLEHTVRKQQPFASRADIAAKLLQSILNLRFPIFFFFFAADVYFNNLLFLL